MTLYKENERRCLSKLAYHLLMLEDSWLMADDLCVMVDE